MGGFGGAGNNIGGLRYQVEANIGPFNRDMREANRTVDQTEAAMERADAKARELKGAFIAAGAATGILAYGLNSIVQGGMEVERTLATIEATSGATAEEMTAISDEINNLGAELPVSLQDSATAAQELAFSGMNAAEVVESLSGVAELASASTLSVADSAETVANTLNMFELEASRADAVADAMAGTFSSSSTTMEEFAQAMEYAGSVANTAGQDITTVSAAIGILGDAGIKGSRAGTALRGSLSRLANLSGPAAEAMADLGLSIEDLTDSEGDFKDLTEIAAIFDEQLQDLSEQERLEAMSAIFGQEAAPAMLALANNTDEFAQKVDSISVSQIAGALDAVTNVDPEKIAEVNSELTALAQQSQMPVAIQLTAEMDRRAILAEFRSVADDLSREELAAQIGVALDLGEREALQLAVDIQGEESIGKLIADLDKAQTAGSLTAAQMDTIGGKIEYIRGSLSSVSFAMFEGIQPLLSPILDSFIGLVDILTAHKAAAQAAGVALVGLTAVLGTATIALGAMYGQLALNNLLTQANTKSLYSYRAASWAASTATGTFTTVLKALRGASLSSAASLFTLSGATSAASAGIAALRTAVLSLYAAVPGLGWALLALSAAAIAYQTNFLGFADAVNTVVGPIADLLGWVWDLASGIVDLGIAIGGVPLRMLSYGFGLLVDAVSVFIPQLGWLSDGFDAAGDAVMTFLGPLIRLPAFLSEVAGILDTISGQQAFAAVGTGAAMAAGYVGDLLDPLGILDGLFGSVGGGAGLFHSALTAIPGVGLLVWLADATGLLDTLRADFDAAVGSVRELPAAISSALSGPFTLPEINLGEFITTANIADFIYTGGVPGMLLRVLGLDRYLPSLDLRDYIDVAGVETHIRGALSWINQGGLLAPIIGEFDRLNTAVEIVTNPLESVRGYLQWVNQGGLLSPLLGEFTLLGGAVDTLNTALDLVVGYLEWANRGGLLAPLIGDVDILGSTLDTALNPLESIVGYLQWVNQGGLLAPLLGEFTLVGGAVDTLNTAFDLSVGYLQWLNQGGLLSPLLGEFTLLGGAIDAVVWSFDAVVWSVGVFTDAVGLLTAALGILWDAGAAIAGWAVGGTLDTTRRYADDVAFAVGFATGILEGLYDVGAGFVGWALHPVIEGVNDVVGYLQTQADTGRRKLNELKAAGVRFTNWVLTPIVRDANRAMGWMRDQADRARNGINNLLARGEAFARLTLQPVVGTFNDVRSAIDGTIGRVDRLISRIEAIPSMPDVDLNPFDNNRPRPRARQPPGPDPQKAREKGRKAGRGTAEGYAEGQNEGKAAVENATRGAMRAVDKLLPGSDAETGPLSNLTEMGRQTPETFAAGMRSSNAPAAEAERLAARTKAALPSTVDGPTVVPTADERKAQTAAEAVNARAQDATLTDIGPTVSATADHQRTQAEIDAVTRGAERAAAADIAGPTIHVKTEEERARRNIEALAEETPTATIETQMTPPEADELAVEAVKERIAPETTVSPETTVAPPGPGGGGGPAAAAAAGAGGGERPGITANRVTPPPNVEPTFTPTVEAETTVSPSIQTPSPTVEADAPEPVAEVTAEPTVTPEVQAGPQAVDVTTPTEPEPTTETPSVDEDAIATETTQNSVEINAPLEVNIEVDAGDSMDEEELARIVEGKLDPKLEEHVDQLVRVFESWAEGGGS